MNVHVVIIGVAGEDRVYSKVDVIACYEFHFIVVPYFDGGGLDLNLSGKFVIAIFVDAHGPGDVLGRLFAIS
jgi:hypothetical protein